MEIALLKDLMRGTDFGAIAEKLSVDVDFVAKISKRFVLRYGRYEGMASVFDEILKEAEEDREKPRARERQSS